MADKAAPLLRDFHSDEKHEEFGNSRSWRDPGIHFVLPSAMLALLSYCMLIPVVPSLKLHWYTDPERMKWCDQGFPRCNSDDANNAAHCCDPDFARTQFYGSWFDSGCYLITFLISATLGRVSDAVGRKPVLLLQATAMMLPLLSLYMFDGESAVAYYGANAVGALVANGKGMSGSAAFYYLSDCYTKKERMRYFAMTGAVMAASLALSPLINLMHKAYGDDFLYIVGISLSATNAAWVLLVIPESLPPAKRRPFDLSVVNPLAPLKLLNRSSMLRWTAAVAFLGSLPETGVVEIVLIYVYDVLGLVTEDSQNLVSSNYLTAIGCCAFVVLGVLVPFMNRSMTDVQLLCVCMLGNATHMLVYAALKIWPYPALLYSNALFSALAVSVTTVLQAMLSKSMGPAEQGFALGTLSAVVSLCGIFGPLMFGQLYAWAKELDSFCETMTGAHVNNGTAGCRSQLSKSACEDLAYNTTELSVTGGCNWVASGPCELPFLVGSALAFLGLWIGVVPLQRAIRAAPRIQRSHSVMYSPKPHHGLLDSHGSSTIFDGEEGCSDEGEGYSDDDEVVDHLQDVVKEFQGGHAVAAGFMEDDDSSLPPPPPLSQPS